MAKVLITGATGLVGKNLIPLLQDKDHEIAILSRKKFYNRNFAVYQWNIGGGWMEQEALEGIDYIIHLAGANIGEKRWTERRKKEIVNSRVESARLLYEYLAKTKHKVKAVISASGVGFYGDGGEKIFTETDPPAKDFLGQTCLQWENAIQSFSNLNTRVVIFRFGIVLSKEADILKKLVSAMNLFIAPVFSDGRQYISWIHLDDLCNMLVKAIEDEKLNSVYNATAPSPVTNKFLAITLAKALQKHVMTISIPPFALKIGLGEMSTLLIESTRVSSQKIIHTGFQFKYPDLELTLRQIFQEC